MVKRFGLCFLSKLFRKSNASSKNTMSNNLCIKSIPSFVKISNSFVKMKLFFNKLSDVVSVPKNLRYYSQNIPVFSVNFLITSPKLIVMFKLQLFLLPSPFLFKGKGSGAMLLS